MEIKTKLIAGGGERATYWLDGHGEANVNHDKRQQNEKGGSDQQRLEPLGERAELVINL